MRASRPLVVGITAILTSSLALWAPAALALPAERNGANRVRIREFSSPPGESPGPIGFSDGNVWVAFPNENAVGRLRRGRIRTFLLPDPYQEPRGIAADSNGGAWFTETGGHGDAVGLGHVDRTGAIDEFPLPTGVRPFGTVIGPDGNVWFTSVGFPWGIGSMTPTGTATMLPVTLHNEPLNIIVGPDGALWFTEDGIVNGGSGAIGRVTTSGALTEYLLPPPAGFNSGAGDIAVGPDANLWFTCVTWASSEPDGMASRSIGRITPAGEVTEFPVAPTRGWPPGGIAAGGDGNLWFTEGPARVIGRMSVTGAVSHFRVPRGYGFPIDITAGGGDVLWMSEGSAIARFHAP